MYETIQLLHQGQEIQNRGNILVVVDDGIITFIPKLNKPKLTNHRLYRLGQTSNQPSLTEQELERVREELRVQKELNEQQQQASSRARFDIVGQMESIMENELQCGICSELMVFVSCFDFFKYYSGLFIVYFRLPP